MNRQLVNSVTGGKRRIALALLSGCAIALSSCASAPTTKVSHLSKAKPAQSKEYFSQAEYGVKASPRVVSTTGSKAKRLPRGGGRAQVGKPYKVRGKWYTPRLDPNYQASGTASWYGDAFHGRLTANGEVYDMNHLSAAHPTMPLPSYARVTNLKNGNSVIVRVNDRGPYAHNRLVDLSKRAAQLLDYTHSGTAQVKMEYVGPAPVNGADDDYLMASYQPGSGATPANAVQQPVMVASADMNADAALPGVNAFAGEIAAAPGAAGGEMPVTPSAIVVKQPRMAVARAVTLEPMSAGEMPIVPALAPAPSDRPQSCVGAEPCEDGTLRGALSGYASQRVAESHSAKAFSVMGLEVGANRDWKDASQGERILVGTFAHTDLEKAKAAVGKLAMVEVEITPDGSGEVFALPVSGKSADWLLKRVWKLGYTDAFALR